MRCKRCDHRAPAFGTRLCVSCYRRWLRVNWAFLERRETA